MNGEHQFVYSNDEFAELKKRNEELQLKNHEETLASIPEEEQTEEMKAFQPRPLTFCGTL